MKCKIAKFTAAAAAASLVLGVCSVRADDADKGKDQAGQQSGQAGQAGQAGAQIGEAAGASTQQAEDPQAFIKEAYQENLTEIELGRIAQQKGQSKEVKDFGQHLIQGHQALNQKLKQLGDQKNIQVSDQLDAKHQRMVDELSTLSGADFDKKFMSDQVKAHKKDISLYQQAATKNTDPEVKSFAQDNIAALRQHLQMAQQQSGVSEPAGAEQKGQQQDQPQQQQDQQQQQKPDAK
jgi:putative membrane protein